MNATPEETLTVRYRRGLLLAVGLTCILFILRFGYDYGVSDQEEFLAVLLHRLNPAILSTDWFVQLQIERINVRTGFVAALTPLAHLMPVWLVVLTVQALAVVLCTSAVFTLAWRAMRATAPAVAATLIVLVLTPYWTLGGNDILNRMLVPSTVSWGLALWSFIALLRLRYVASGVLLGLAALCQPLIALQIFMVNSIFVTVRASEPSQKTQWLSAYPRFLVPFALVGSWLLLPLVLEQFSGFSDSALWTSSTAAPDAVTILTRFRAPHHYLPGSFPLSSYVRFSFLTLFGVAGILLVRKRDNSQFAHASTIVLLTIAALLLISFAGTYVLHLGTVVKLQLFKLTVLAKVLLVVSGTAGIWSLLPGSVRERLSSLGEHRYTGVAVSAVLATGAVLAASVPSLTSRVLPFLDRNAGPEGTMIEWVQSHTPASALFAIPPSLSGFRTRSGRPVFVDFKAIPFHDDALAEWYRRLMVEASWTTPGGLGEVSSESRRRDLQQGGVPAMLALDAAYDSMNSDTVQRLIADEQIVYFLRREAFFDPDSPSFVELVYQNSDWYLYRSIIRRVTSN